MATRRIDIHPLRVPVFDFDDFHSRWPDHHDVNLVRLDLMIYRKSQIAEQNPFVFSLHGMKTTLEVLNRLLFALIYSGTA